MSNTNIIGVSGRKSSGKDTVGKIIQYLTFEGNIPYSLGEVLQNPEECNWIFGSPNMIWQKKQFAGKLKQIVSILIGCKVEDLEDETFKNTPLGPEWDRWYAPELSIRKLTHEEYALVSDNQKEWLKLEQMTPRKMLQIIGTEGLRDLIHPNVHVNALFADYKLSPESVRVSERLYPKWIIPDTRFPNEAEAILKRNGIVVRVENPRVDHSDQHPSEISLDDWSFNYTIMNDKDIPDLIEKVRIMLVAFKII